MSSHCSKISIFLPNNCCPYAYSNVTQWTMVGFTEIKIIFLNLFIHSGRVSLFVPYETIDPINRPQPKSNWIKEAIHKVGRVAVTSSRVFLLMASFLSVLGIYRSLVSVIFRWKLDEDFDTKCIKYEVVTLVLNTF